MNKREATNIKDEILRKEGSIHICNAITIDGVVLIKDILDIIDKHTAESVMNNMSLEEAIKRAEEVSKHNTINCFCAEEHRQLAEWLKDYKRLLDQETPKKESWIGTK